MAIDESKYVEMTDRMRALMDIFFEEESSAEERRLILEEMAQNQDYLAGALFGILRWPYFFQLDGEDYTLQYNPTYCLELFRSEYELNLYRGTEEGERIRQEKGRKSPIFLKFLTLIHEIKCGRFHLGSF